VPGRCRSNSQALPFGKRFIYGDVSLGVHRQPFSPGGT
jgi:hypothetical protein